MTMEDFYNALKKIFPRKFPRKGDRTLYHYTTADTFDKLVDEGGELYCTHYMDLNDDAEFWKGFDYFRDWQKKHTAQESKEKAIECDRYFSQLKTELKKVHKLYIDATWIMSFSTEKDSLSQWRSYTDRTNGGVAVGFSKNELENEINKCRNENGFDVALLPCIYYDSGIDKRLDRLIDLLLESIDKNKTNWHEELARAIYLFSSIVKDGSFRLEHEWRIIIQATNIEALKGAKVIGGKVRLPLGVGVNGERRVGMLMKEVLLSPHGNKNRLLHSVVLPKYSCDKLSYNVHSSKLPYNGK